MSKKKKNVEVREVLAEEFPFKKGLLEKAPVKIVTTTEMGRYVIATKKIKAGKSILSDHLYTHSICHDFLLRVCNFCMKCTTKRRLPLICEKCKHVAYCTEFCQKESDHLQTGECNVFTRVNYSLLDPKDHADVDMIIRMILLGAIEKANSTENGISSHNSSEITTNTTEIGAVCENSSSEESESESSSSEINNSTEKDDNLNLNLAHNFELARKCEANMNGVKNKRYEVLNNMARVIFDCTETSCGLLKLELEDIVLLLRLQETNVYGLYEKSTGNMHSQSLYPFGAMFNHACWPNAAPTFSTINKHDDDSIKHRPVLSVMALRDIKKGEEITIRYGTPNKTLQMRRKFFMYNYGFECGCLRCKEDGSETPFSCPRFPACIGLLIVNRSDDQEYWCTRCAMVVKLTQMPRKKRLAILNE